MRFRNDSRTRFVDGARVRPGAKFSTNDPQFTDAKKRAKLPGGKDLEVLVEGETESTQEKVSARNASRRQKVTDGETGTLDQAGNAVL